MKIENNRFYISVFKNSWTYVTGAILLSVLQILTMAVTGEPWGITRAIANWGAWMYTALGGSVDNWPYFSSQADQAVLSSGFLQDPGSIRNIGIIFGALFASLMASQFKIKMIKSRKQVLAAVLGGLLMGYGARIASGCNIGALYGGIASLSVSGWVFAVFLFLGAMVGSRLLVKYFM